MNPQDSKILGKLRSKIIENWGMIFWDNILLEFEKVGQISKMPKWARDIIYGEKVN